MHRYVTTRTIFIIGTLLGLAWVALSQSGEGGHWKAAGQNLNNSRSQPNEQIISAANVNTLAAKWVFTTAADVSATPTVAGGAIYFPDWAGNLYAVKAANGTLLWSRQISSYDDFPGAVARVSPGSTWPGHHYR